MKRERAELVEKDHPKLSQRTQCELLDGSRWSLHYRKAPEKPQDQRIMEVMDAVKAAKITKVGLAKVTESP